MSRWLLALTLMVTGCGAERWEVTVPPGELWMATFTLDGVQVLGGSGLERWTEGGFYLEPSDAPLGVAAWTSASLSDLDLDAIAASRQRVRAPAPCEARLPPADWRAHYEDGTLTSAIEGDLPLTLDALQDRCPATTVLADATCRPGCEAAVTRDGCWADVSTECDLPAFEARVDADGALCVVPPPDCEAVEVSGFAVEIRCLDTCTQRVMAAPAEPLLEVETFPLVDDLDPILPNEVIFGDRFLPEDLLWGHAFDLVALPDAVVASVHANAGAACRLDHPDARLVRVEPSGVRTSSAAPPCLLALAPLPEGFLGVHAEIGRWAFSVFDPALARTDTGLRLQQPEVGRHRPFQAAPLAPGARRVAVLFQPLDPGPDLRPMPGADLLALVDLDAGTVDVQPLGPGRRFSMVAVDGALVFAVDDALRLEWYDPARAEVVRTAPLFEETQAILAALPDVRALPDGTLLTSVTRRPALIAYAADRRTLGGFFEAKLEPTHTAPWPAEPGLAVAFGVGRGDDRQIRGWAALYDPSRGTARAGGVPLGPSAVRRAVVGPNGDVWALAPWTGELLRIRPASP